MDAGLVDALRERMIAAGTGKHVVQQASIAGNLRRKKLLPPLSHDGLCVPCAPDAEGVAEDGKEGGRKVTVLELGAGRAMLGLVVAGVAASDKGVGSVELTMVERCSVRRKAGTRVRTAEKGAGGGSKYGFDTTKLVDNEVRVDLEHMLLSEVVKDDGNDVVVVAKHLCGAGTDIALRGIAKIKVSGWGEQGQS
jgi:tRNA:m4X modification enzyme